MLGLDIRPHYTEPRNGEVKRFFADISEAKEKLGYNSKVNFDEGLKMAVEWFKQKELFYISETYY